MAEKTLFREDPGGSVVKGFPHVKNRWPVLVAGCGRTGTSLMLSLLAANDDFVAPPIETNAFNDLRDMDKSYKVGLEDKWLWKLFEEKPSAVRWAEKSPPHIMFAEDIYRFFDGQVFFIFMIRDGRNVITSSEDTKHNDRIFQAFKQAWLLRTWRALDLKRMLPDNAMLVDYEDLTEVAQFALRKVFNHIETEEQPAFWDDWSRARFDSGSKAGNIMEDKRIKRGFICADNERWKKPEHGEVVHRFMADRDVLHLMTRLGYIE